MALLNTPPSKVISTFDFVDIAKNVGVISFYPAMNYKAAAKEYSLMNTTSFRSGTNSTQAEFVALAESTKLDLTFEVLMNASSETEGDILLNVPMRLDSLGADFSTTGYISGAAFISGAALTSLGNFVSQSITAPGSTAVISKLAVKMTPPKLRNKIRKGDYLRLEIAGIGNINNMEGGGRIGQINLGHDPSNSETNGNAGEEAFLTVGSRATMFLPVRIQT